MPLLNPTVDLVFKLLLTRQPVLLRDMLQGVLARPVHDLTILNPDIPGDLSGDKQIVLDVRARLDDGSRSDVEMQCRVPPALASRLVYYGARDYTDQLRRGGKYQELEPTVVIAWLVEPLFTELNRLHSVFEWRERHSHTLLSDRMTIHLLQLSYLSPTGASGYTGQVERWARFFVARTPAEFARLASEDPIMRIAVDTLEQLSQDPDVHRQAHEREESMKLYRMSLNTSRREGQADMLLAQLRVRFGEPPQDARERVRRARPEQLRSWAERVLTVGSLDEVLAP